MADPTQESQPILRAALYAACTFMQLQDSDVSFDEVAELLVHAQKKQTLLGTTPLSMALILLLLHDTPESRAAIREVLHDGKSSVSDDDLSDLANFVNQLASAIRCNQGLEGYIEAEKRRIGAFSVEERRAAVLEVLAEHSGDHDEQNAQTCIDALTRYERPFAALSVLDVRGMLQRIVLSGNAGGKMPDGSPRIGLSGAAAKLAVLANAFGDKNERNSKAAFDHADRVEEKKLKARQVEARAVSSATASRNRKV